MKCPDCGKELILIDYVDSVPCHFSYSEDASEDFSAEQYQCQNSLCDSYEEYFYLNLEDGSLYRGLILGG